MKPTKVKRKKMTSSILSYPIAEEGLPLPKGCSLLKPIPVEYKIPNPSNESASPISLSVEKQVKE